MSLENRMIKTSETLDVPALSQKWVTQKKFLTFISPACIGTIIDEKEWTELVTSFNKDLKWLLKLPHHKFWSQIIFDKSLHGSLVSFLQEAPRFYNEDPKQSYPKSDLFKQTEKNVFLVFLRMSTSKESKDCFISNEAFGKLIYDNYIFDLPKIMDLCVLYGPTNPTLLSKMITNIFSNQPKYSSDLAETTKSLAEILRRILEQLGLDEIQGAGAGSKTEPLSYENIIEIIQYILDIAANLWYFLEIYPPAATTFVSDNILNQLSDFYEKILPKLTQEIHHLPEDHKTRTIKQFSIARKLIVQICNTLLHSITIKKLLAHSGEDYSVELEKFVDNWLEWSTYLVSERHHYFFVDYNSLFPIQDDIDLMTQLGIQMDQTRVDYIKEGLKGFIVEFGLSLTPITVRGTDGGEDPQKMAELISLVKELMPDLQDSFVKECLKHYEYNAETVINAILEGNLAPHLTNKQDAVREPSVAPTTSAMAQPLDISKKSRTKTVHFDEMKEVLDNKQGLKSVILEQLDAAILAEYEDEYDDTYDDHAVGSEEPDAHTGEEDFGRSFTIPRVLRPKSEEASEDELEDDAQATGTEKPKDQFVPNPAELRERAEQRRMSRRGGHDPGRHSSWQRNVIGAPRGQGQDKETVLARRQKMLNKGSAGNHNRRQAADRKRREF